MASPARPFDDGLLEPVDGQAPLIHALVRGMIEHTRSGIVSVLSDRTAPAKEPG